MKPEPLSRDQIRELVRRVQAGEARADVAARFGVSRSTVGRHMDMHRMTQATGPRRVGPYRGSDLAWMEHAKCRGLSDPTKSPDRRHFTEWPVNEQAAVCKDGCPVRMECLDYGLRGPLGYSRANEVFGGLSPRRLAALQRQRLESVAS